MYLGLKRGDIIIPGKLWDICCVAVNPTDRSYSGSKQPRSQQTRVQEEKEVCRILTTWQGATTHRKNESCIQD